MDDYDTFPRNSAKRIFDIGYSGKSNRGARGAANSKRLSLVKWEDIGANCGNSCNAFMCKIDKY